MKNTPESKTWLGLYEEQRKAVDKMHNGCILKGGVGSGKSITSLAYYYKLNGGDIDSQKYSRMRDAPMSLCIITTAQKRDLKEWEDELSRFHMTPNPELSNYKHTIVIDSWNNIGKYKSLKNWFFIFDEDRVTGSGAWVKAFYQITKNNRWILLSATPGDQWTDYIPVFVANGFYKNKTDFQHQHVIFDPYVTKYPKIKGYFNEMRLKQHRDALEVDIDMLRSTNRHDTYIECGYSRQDYLYVTRERWNPIKGKPVENIAELCSLWRRISNNPEERIEVLKELLKKLPDKVIVFYNFDYELDVLHELDGYLDYKTAEWNGHKHEPIPQCDRWIYLVNYMSGAEGWNCILTNTIVFFSQTYSYKKLEQAKGRIDRANTTFKDLYYYHFVSKSPLDKAILLTLKNKKEFNNKKYLERIKIK